MATPEGGSVNLEARNVNLDVLNELFQIAVGLHGNGDRVSGTMQANSYLVGYSEEYQTSRANAMRMRNGGDLPEIPSAGSDDFVNCMRLIARDLWPSYFLLPPPSEGARTFYTAAPVGVIQHPRLEATYRALLSDARLAKLFPDVAADAPMEEISRCDSIWYVSGGISGTKDPLSLLSGLMFDASVRARLGGEHLTFESLSRHLEESIDTLRRLADGESVRVPTIVGFSGARLPVGASVELGDGTFRSMRPVERDLLFGAGKDVTLVYETSFPLSIYAITENDFRAVPEATSQKWHAATREAHRSFNADIDKARLSLLLCSEGENFLATREHSRFFSDPTSLGGISAVESGSPIVCHDVSFEIISEAVQLHRIVRNVHPDSLDIAMRRVLLAASSRDEVADSLIDALVAWENMFGTSQETTFRVTASLAKLVESDQAARREFQKVLSKIYSTRSKLVHGAKELPLDDASYKQRVKAIRVAIDGLRSLYVDRNDLLGLKSEERSMRLLLEG
ncbi:HEPN domain-containing protein [Streptomyces tagetis]|uniref:Apea-like HEPN domain-containing protein n=1 Tax=Streptomyces tagetis TaxID=2820809 RepID=A0A941B629_9ACTN|nr:HEPN domain-containing protein [Streptomyces sp. RG38]MBQ0830847.1 hypothetical protein [Streptomyces sp. RG38]